MFSFDPIRAAVEIREQLASDKRKLGFFFGAGTSMALGLPGIDKLTADVESKLKSPYKAQVEAIKTELSGNPNIEDILNRIRLYKELIGQSDTQEYCSIRGRENAQKLDVEVCQKISEIIGVLPDNINPHVILAHFIRSLHMNREHPIELFTTNYDLIIEHAFESVQLPYFDGFVGSVSPFFIQESIEAQLRKEKGLHHYPPRSWTRLWKVHGSINWEMDKTKNQIVRRLSNSKESDKQELMIFPSREKYSQSRKLPFITLQDRLRDFLSSGEVLLVVHGYSFSDEHLNEIVFQSLRANQHLSVITFVFDNLPSSYEQYGKDFRNLSFYAPDKLCIGGVVSNWAEPSLGKKGITDWPFWDNTKKEFNLGNFEKFASYLEIFIGFRSQNISHLNDTNIQENTDRREETSDEK